MSRSAFSVALLVVALAATAHGQTQPGVTFKIRTQLRNHQNVEKSHPDSVRIKRQAAAAAARAAADINVDAGADAGNGRAGGGAPGGGTGTNNVLTMNGSFIKGRGRMDVLGVIGSPELGATQSAIFTDTSSTVIDDVEKIWYDRVFNIGSILDFTSSVDNPNTKVGLLKVSWDSLPGETYESMPAKHYQLKMQYGLGQRPREDSLKLLAITTVTSDYWVVDLPVNFENRFAGIGRPRRMVPDSLRSEWDKMLALYVQLGKGTIVKFTAAGTIGENTERATEYTRTMEMTAIKAAPVDPAILHVPADYTKQVPQRGRPPA